MRKSISLSQIALYETCAVSYTSKSDQGFNVQPVIIKPVYLTEMPEV